MSSLARLTLESDGKVDALMAMDFPGSGRKVDEELTHNIATIGENMTVRRAATQSVGAGTVVSYVHNATAAGLGKIGVLVALESTGDADQLTALGKQIAMHIAATAPASVSVDDLDPALVERERAVLSDQARASGKPEEIIAKMVEGRLRKYYEEAVLLEQVFVIDNETKVGKVVENAAADLAHRSKSPVSRVWFSARAWNARKPISPLRWPRNWAADINASARPPSGGRRRRIGGTNALQTCPVEDFRRGVDGIAVLRLGPIDGRACRP